VHEFEPRQVIKYCNLAGDGTEEAVMADWVKIGTRYFNLENVCELHVRMRPRSAKLFFVGGGVVDLDEDDTDAIVSVLDAVAVLPEGGHRTVIQLSEGK
jgi:hypothetical protein